MRTDSLSDISGHKLACCQLGHGKYSLERRWRQSEKKLDFGFQQVHRVQGSYCPRGMILEVERAEYGLFLARGVYSHYQIIVCWYRKFGKMIISKTTLKIRGNNQGWKIDSGRLPHK